MLSMLGKRVSARVNGGFLSLPWPSPTIAVSVIALFYADRIHFIPLLLSAVGIVVRFVQTCWVFANLSCMPSSKSKGINSLAVHTPVSSTVPFVDFQYLELL